MAIKNQSKILKIKSCQLCGLSKNQRPAIHQIKSSDIMFIGISSQKNTKDKIFEPLDEKTNSGKFISQIEKLLTGKTFYKTNLVKCAPLDSENKIRSPTQNEITLCFPNLKEEIKNVKPKVIILLGKQVSEAISNNFSLRLKKYTTTKYGNITIIPIDHPSYIMIYKRKQLRKYLSTIAKLLRNL